MKLNPTFLDLNPKIHDRKRFDCGEKALNDFLKTKAAKHMKSGISRTQVALASDHANQRSVISVVSDDLNSIASYFTVAPGAFERDVLPQEMAKRLPHYPVPVFLIGQLAVDTRWQQQGQGKVTLIKSLEYLWRVHQVMPAYAVVVDCISDTAESFYKHFGFHFLTEINGKSRWFLSMKTIGQLFD